MLRWIRGRIGCLFGRHHRSKRYAKLEGGVYVTTCTWCGVRMRQRGNKDWVVDRAG